MSKIFGIGLPRTGTASLCEALIILGYNASHYPKYVERAEKFDALTDTPICNSYVELDNKYPGSKLILTTREINGWLISCEKAARKFRWGRLLLPDGKCGLEVYESHINLLGSTSYNCELFTEGFKKHNLNVMVYFRGRRQDLLIFDVRQGWNPLCKFLDLPVPKVDFPNRNKS